MSLTTVSVSARIAILGYASNVADERVDDASVNRERPAMPRN